MTQEMALRQRPAVASQKLYNVLPGWIVRLRGHETTHWVLVCTIRHPHCGYILKSRLRR